MTIHPFNVPLSQHKEGLITSYECWSHCLELTATHNIDVWELVDVGSVLLKRESELEKERAMKELNCDCHGNPIIGQTFRIGASLFDPISRSGNVIKATDQKSGRQHSFDMRTFAIPVKFYPTETER